MPHPRHATGSSSHAPSHSPILTVAQPSPGCPARPPNHASVLPSFLPFLSFTADPRRSQPVEALPDRRPDVCLFVLPPHASADPAAARAVRKLAKHLPVIPLLAHADTLAPQERAAQQAAARCALRQHSAVLYRADEGLLAAQAAGLGLVGECLPAAVAAASENDDSVGRQVHGHVYRVAASSLRA